MASNVIYCLKCRITGKRYIGQAVDFSTRIKGHAQLTTGKHFNQYLQNHYNKHHKNKTLEEAFEITILEEGIPENMLADAERRYIREYRTDWNKAGFNLTAGGEGGRRSLATKKRMSQAQIKLRGVVVHVYTIAGRYIRTFGSIVETAEYMQLNRNAVSNALNRKIQYTGYFFSRELMPAGWKYTPRRHSKKVYVFNKDKEMIDVVASLVECSDKYNINYNTINTSRVRGSLVKGKYYFSKSPALKS